jgi:aspartate kinase
MSAEAEGTFEGATADGTVVMKFGGTSVADPERIRHVARRLVAARERGVRVVGTVSAMGRTTDTLLELAHRVSPSPDPRELDMLLSTGERMACALVAMAVHDLGHDAVSFTGSQAGILTDAVYTRAKIREITPVRVLEALERGRIVLVAGFQGFSRDTMDVTTLGRGGTDATAVALAAALGASCEIYSDVAGVFTADPRLVPDARRLPVVSYEEMLEMAASGARVLMLRAVELARGHGVRIHARSTFSDEPGTWVQDESAAADEGRTVRAVTHSLDDVLLTVRGRGGTPVSPAAVLRALAGAQATSDVIVSGAGGDPSELALSVGQEDVAATRRALAVLGEPSGAVEVEETAGLGTVSIVGAGLRSHHGVAARLFRALDEHGVEVRLVSTSPIRITCLVGRDDVERGVRALHDAFSPAALAP